MPLSTASLAASTFPNGLRLSHQLVFLCWPHLTLIDLLYLGKNHAIEAGPSTAASGCVGVSEGGRGRDGGRRLLGQSQQESPKCIVVMETKPEGDKDL